MKSIVTRGPAAAAIVGLGLLAAGCGTLHASGNVTGTAAQSQASSSPGTTAQSAPASSQTGASQTGTSQTTANQSGASQSGTANTTAQAAPECATSALQVHVPAGIGGVAAGREYVLLDFKNVSKATCAVVGFPGVSFVTGLHGKVIGQPASRISADGGKPAVTLRPGATAHTLLAIAKAGNYDPSVCKPVTAKWLQIFPPDQFTALTLAFSSEVCSAKLPKNIGTEMQIGSMEPGPASLGQG